MVTILEEGEKAPTFAQKLSAGVGRGLEMGQQMYTQHQQKKAVESLMGKDVSNLPPEFQKIAFEYGKKQQLEESKRVAQLQGNEKIIRDIEQQRNLPKGSLDAYITNPKMAEQVTRPTKEKAPPGGLGGIPLSQEESEAIRKVIKENPDATAEELELEFNKARIAPGRTHEILESRRRKEEQASKGFDAAYKANEDFINDTTSSYKAFESETKPRLLQMKNIKDEDLIGPTAAAFLETLGIPLGALDDPSSELYQKLSQDLLKGLPETYGNRILKVEVDNFLKTIPTLLNSPEGRRMIASNMLKLGEMKEVYYNEMRRQQSEALESNKFPRDFQQRVFDQVKPQIDRINNEFMKLTEVKAVPQGTIPFFNPSGEIEFVPKEHAQWAIENGGRRIW